MSVYSMTGFASATQALAGEAAEGPARSGSVSVELRSVNSRFLDLALRLADEWRDLEPAMREQVGAAFKRGKIELRLSTSAGAAEGWPQPRPDQLNRLSQLESTVQGWLPNARPLSVNEALGWCRQAGGGERERDAARAAALAATAEAIDALREARAREGARLVEILSERIARLRELAAQAAPLVPAVVARQQQRFIERWNEAIAAAAGNAVSADAQRERALNEAAAYAMRIDVAEELSRLVAHLNEIERLLAAGGEVGKRLDFLIQELHREANTLGSKSAALELTTVAVEMKVAVEQMREQVQNIE
jgi:uncharacterized protein (TIGR00255 family)